MWTADASSFLESSLLITIGGEKEKTICERRKQMVSQPVADAWLSTTTRRGLGEKLHL
jgi:hypothetical protein